MRYSITNPDAYIESNLLGFYNILEACRHSYDDGKKGVEHLVYASSSSVYGTNKKVPYCVEDKVDNPVLPIPPYAVYNIGNSHPENLLEFVDILQQELVHSGVLPKDYDFESHKKRIKSFMDYKFRMLCLRIWRINHEKK